MKTWTVKKGTEVLSRDGNAGRVAMETGLNTVVVVWDKQPNDRFIFTERDIRKLGVVVKP
jgi:hypothetical protein